MGKYTIVIPDELDDEVEQMLDGRTKKYVICKLLEGWTKGVLPLRWEEMVTNPPDGVLRKTK